RRSMSIESVRVVPASTLPGSAMAPASNSSRSVRLVLPASTCARIPRLSVRKGQLLQESDRDCRQGSCRTHHGYLLEKPSADNPLPPSPVPLRNPFSAPAGGRLAGLLRESVRNVVEGIHGEAVEEPQRRRPGIADSVLYAARDVHGRSGSSGVFGAVEGDGSWPSTR